MLVLRGRRDRIILNAGKKSGGSKPAICGLGTATMFIGRSNVASGKGNEIAADEHQRTGSENKKEKE